MRIALLCAVLFATGCSIMPNSLRYFGRGTPAERAAKQVTKTETALGNVAGAVRDNLHMAGEAMKNPPGDRRDKVVSDFLTEAEAIIVKKYPSTPEHDVQLVDLVNRLLSENDKIRTTADAELAKQAKTNNALLDAYATEQAKAAKLALQVKEQIAETEWWAGWAKKAAWALIAIAAIYLGGTVLSIAARFFPAFSAASTLVNTVAAPAVQFAFKRAKVGLEKVGDSLTEMRREMPAIAAKATAVLNDHLDSDHKAIVSSVATPAPENPPA